MVTAEDIKAQKHWLIHPLTASSSDLSQRLHTVSLNSVLYKVASVAKGHILTDPHCHDCIRALSGEF